MDSPSLYLITPPISDLTPYPVLLDEAMTACDVACVLLQTVAQDDVKKESIVRALAPLVQKHDIACLVADDPQLTIRADADGVHIAGDEERLQSASSVLEPWKRGTRR